MPRYECTGGVATVRELIKQRSRREGQYNPREARRR